MLIIDGLSAHVATAGIRQLRDPVKSISILPELRAIGGQLALDDYGTGYSSLSHLRQLPLHRLKIGQPFVPDIGTAGADRPFMRLVLDLAASLDLRAVAEGIETGRQMEALRDIGCGIGQGFPLGGPARPAVMAPRLPAAA